MPAPALQVEGLRTFRRTCKAAGVQMSDLRAAHRAAAELVADRSRPAGPHRTGRLVASTKAVGQPAAAVVKVGSPSRLPYAGPVHWGWPSRHIAAQPWVYETAVDSQQAWENVYLHALTEIIDKVEGMPGQ